MSDLANFGTTAKSLSRNPLGIIALFIVLIYGFAALTLGFNSQLEVGERAPLIWFLVAFPVVVLGLFGWLVSQHYEKLYAPGDYRSDEAFLKKKEITERHTAELLAGQEQLIARVRDTIKEFSVAEPKAQEIADRVTKDIEQATTITVDASDFLQSADAIFSLPVAAFETLGDLTNEVYFKLLPSVLPYRYGYTWVLRVKETGSIVKSLRMLAGLPQGERLHDPRSLREVGVLPGCTLVVERVNP